jgi:hypothetical protein
VEQLQRVVAIDAGSFYSVCGMSYIRCLVDQVLHSLPFSSSENGWRRGGWWDTQDIWVKRQIWFCSTHQGLWEWQ